MRGLLELGLMRHLSADDLRELQECVSIFAYPAGSPVYREGAPAEHLFILRSGEAFLSRYGRTLGLLQPGALFGEGALLEEPRHLADVTARTELTAYGVPTGDLAAYLQSHPTAASHFLLWVVREVTQRLRVTNGLLGAIGDIGQAVSARKPLAHVGRDVLELLLRDIVGAAGAALFLWNRFARDYERLSAIHLDLDAVACSTTADTAEVFYLDNGLVAGVRLAQEEPVGVLFVRRDRTRPPFTRAEEILLETVGHHLTLVIHRAQDCSEEAARHRLRCHPGWQP